jgi:hypothetical protein
MKRVLSITGVALVLGAALALAQNVDGPLSTFEKIGPVDQSELKITFRGGARACVAAQGDHDPVVPLDIAVYDKNDRLIAKDESKGDFVAVCWVPPRTGTYRIVISNHGDKIYNKVYIFSK